MFGKTVPVILVLCAGFEDRREICRLGLHDEYKFLFHEYGTIEFEQMAGRANDTTTGLTTIETELARIESFYHGANISGVITTNDYPGALLASMLASRWKLLGTPALATLALQHKYFSRCIQGRIVPDAVPPYALCDDAAHPPPLQFPIIIKPVKSFFSIGAVRINNAEEYMRLFERAALPEAFFRPFRKIFEHVTHVAFGSSIVLAEQLIRGEQVTLEGYVEDGVCHVIGIVDSVMYPGTRSFQRFEYPSVAPVAIQQRMVAIAEQLTRKVQYQHGFFNIEFIYEVETSTVKIVEVNTRMASQFADLFEKVDGLNSYTILLALCIGKTVQRRVATGLHAFAASCVLRCFSDRFVLRVPSSEEVEHAEQSSPETRIEIIAIANTYLSDHMQDGASFRYAVINIGADSREQLLERLHWCTALLPFEFTIPDEQNS